MVVLKYCDWIRRSLFFILTIFLLQLQYVEAGIPETIEKQDCLKECFTPTCSDLEASCVCNSLLDSKLVTQLGLCAKEACTESKERNAFGNLAQECSIMLASDSITQASSSATATTVNGAGSSRVTSSALSGFISLTGSLSATQRSTTASETAVPTTTAPYPSELEVYPTASPSPNPTDGSDTTTEDSQPGQLSPDPDAEQSNSRRASPLIAAFILVPIIIVSLLVALFFVIRHRRTARRSIISFAGVKGWNLSQIAITRGNDEEQQNGRSTRPMSQVTPLQPFPAPPPPVPPLPPPVRKPSRRGSALKSLPQPPPVVHRPITTISEVSEVSEVSPVETGTFRTMDTELQQAFSEVRRGFQPSLAPSSPRTSMEWSMMTQSPSDIRPNSAISRQ